MALLLIVLVFVDLRVAFCSMIFFKSIENIDTTLTVVLPVFHKLFFHKSDSFFPISEENVGNRKSNQGKGLGLI